MRRLVQLGFFALIGCTQGHPVAPVPLPVVQLPPATGIRAPAEAGPWETIRELASKHAELEAARAEVPCCGQEERDSSEQLEAFRGEAFATFGEAGLIELLDRRCLAQPESCTAYLDRRDGPLLFAASLLEAFGSERTLELLARADSKGVHLPIHAETLWLRLMLQSDRYGACLPPSEQELSTMRAELASFLVIDRVAGTLTPRRPTPTELDDLAYFMVTVKESGPAVGELPPGEVHGTQCNHPLGESEYAARERVSQAMDEARRTGSVAATVDAERAYLGTLGYPGPIEVCLDGKYEWTGSWHSPVMRSLASHLETLGQTDEAEALYRRANPGGGSCGTGTYSRWKQQLEGTIRTGERSRGCRRVVAERLLALSEDYGPERLVTSGYDLERIYRGALLTRHRKGAEAWEQRLFAVEGFADTAQRRALEPLLALLPVLSDSERGRALNAIGELAQRFSTGPCLEETFRFGRSFSFNHYRRRVRGFAHSCDTRLDDAHAEALSKQVAKWLKDPSAKVREAAATALGKVASPWSRSVLESLAQRDPTVSGQVCVGSSCARPYYPVRDAAEVALQAITAASEPPSP